MNPQTLSSLLVATDHIRPMRGGAQSHMLHASDGNAYVVKFANNPQSPRVLVNEWLACSIGRALGLTIPEPVILSVPEGDIPHDLSYVRSSKQVPVLSDLKNLSRAREGC